MVLVISGMKGNTEFSEYLVWLLPPILIIAVP